VIRVARYNVIPGILLVALVLSAVVPSCGTLCSANPALKRDSENSSGMQEDIIRAQLDALEHLYSRELLGGYGQQYEGILPRPGYCRIHQISGKVLGGFDPASVVTGVLRVIAAEVRASWHCLGS